MPPVKLHNPYPDGIHYLIEFFGCDYNELDSLVFWKRLFISAVKQAGLKVLNRRFYKFNPHGITGYILLSASHISIHTWPEYGYAACDVFSCGGEDETLLAVEHIKEALTHAKVKIKRIKRGFRQATMTIKHSK